MPQSAASWGLPALYLRRVVDAELDARLGVIAGTGFGYVRPDGIAVIPVGALAP